LQKYKPEIKIKPMIAKGVSKMKTSIFRRKKSLVDPELQFRIARTILGYLLLYTITLILMFGVPIRMILTASHGEESQKLQAIGKLIVDDQFFWVILIIFIVVVALHSIMVTRSIAGPAFVIRRQLVRAINGELSQITLRKDDHFQDIKDLLNEHFSQLGQTIYDIKQSSLKMNNLVDELSALFADKNSDRIKSQSLLNQLQEELKKLELTSSRSASLPIN
jgi:methyl-accepting chemotaxis protein